MALCPKNTPLKFPKALNEGGEVEVLWIVIFSFNRPWRQQFPLLSIQCKRWISSFRIVACFIFIHSFISSLWWSQRNKSIVSNSGSTGRFCSSSGAQRLNGRWYLWRSRQAKVSHLPFPSIPLSFIRWQNPAAAVLVAVVGNLRYAHTT